MSSPGVLGEATWTLKRSLATGSTCSAQRLARRGSDWRAKHGVRSGRKAARASAALCTNSWRIVRRSSKR
eukprot:1403781-Lingulodinium_polyedra.AAC.1